MDELDGMKGNARLDLKLVRINEKVDINIKLKGVLNCPCPIPTVKGLEALSFENNININLSNESIKLTKSSFKLVPKGDIWLIQKTGDIKLQVSPFLIKDITTSFFPKGNLFKDNHFVIEPIMILAKLKDNLIDTKLGSVKFIADLITLANYKKSPFSLTIDSSEIDTKEVSVKYLVGRVDGLFDDLNFNLTTNSLTIKKDNKDSEYITPLKIDLIGSKKKNELIFSSLCEKETELVNKVILSLKNNDLTSLGKIMTQNQEYLEKLGVSNNVLRNMIEIANKTSFGSKITGAGLGGCIISCVDNAIMYYLFFFLSFLKILVMIFSQTYAQT